MSLCYENINVFWTSLIVEECIRNGITQFCISPGSRSSAITVAIARHPKAHNKIFYDERGAAFYALGYARASGKPAVLVCTSGTAVANYLPAIIEASIDKIPLIVLSADRPPELLDTGANQTIVQPGMYGKYCVWDTNLPCPTEEIPTFFVLTTVDQAIYQAKNARGVAHINCMFREPLAPTNAFLSKGYIQQIKAWEMSTSPYTSYFPSTTVTNVFDEVFSLIAQASRGIIVVGHMHNKEEISAVHQFVLRCKWPVVVDICSGLRFKMQEGIISHFDHILLDKDKWKDYNLDCVLHIGGRLVSKRYLQFIDQYRPQKYVIVKNNSARYDPHHFVTHHVESCVADFCQKMLPYTPLQCEEAFWQLLLDKQARIQSIHNEFFCKPSLLNELACVVKISELTTADIGVFIGNSLAIRYFDMYAQGVENAFVASNRGASGIDGNLATAIGFSQGLRKPVAVVMGDISLLHDLNSLKLLRDNEYPICLVLLNNQGGSIFRQLPISQFSDVFEKYFITPHTLTFEKVADMFGIHYYVPSSNEEFTKIYSSFVNNYKTCIIEIKTDRDYNMELQKEVYG